MILLLFLWGGGGGGGGGGIRRHGNLSSDYDLSGSGAVVNSEPEWSFSNDMSLRISTRECEVIKSARTYPELQSCLYLLRLLKPVKRVYGILQ